MPHNQIKINADVTNDEDEEFSGSLIAYRVARMTSLGAFPFPLRYQTIPRYWRREEPGMADRLHPCALLSVVLGVVVGMAKPSGQTKRVGS